MRLLMSDNTMSAWLATQVRIIEAWREEVAMHVDIDLDMVNRLAQHYQWLTSEIAHLQSQVNPDPGH